MRYRLLLPLLAGPALGFGQATGTVGNNYTDVLDKGNSIVAFSPRDEGVQGSPLLLCAWTLADVLLRGNAAPKRVAVQYDVAHQQLRVRRAAGDSAVVPLGQVQEFTLSPGEGPRRFVRLAAPGAPGGLAEVLSPGPHLQLLKYWDKVVAQAPSSTSSYAAPTSVSTYADLPRYYLQGPQAPPAEVRPKRASLQEALAAYPAALAALAALKARKGNINSESDLRAAVTALDALVP